MLIDGKIIQNAFPSTCGDSFNYSLLFGFQEKEKGLSSKFNEGYDAVGKVPLVCWLEIKCIQHSIILKKISRIQCFELWFLQ